MKIKPASKSFFALLLSLTTIYSLAFSPSVLAAEEKKCKVNDVEFSSGDTITYTLEISQANDKFSGIDISIYYDPDCLELNTEKVSVPVFKNALFNSDLKGEIRFNAIDIVDGFDFTNGGVVISAPFKIKDGEKQSSDITFSIRELYDMDSNNMTDYKTDVTIEKGEAPAEEIVKPKSISEVEKELVTQYGVELNEPNEEQTFPVTLVVACGVLAGAVAAVVILLILKKAREKSSSEDEK